MSRSYRRHLPAALSGLAAAVVLSVAAVYSYGEFYEPTGYDQAVQSYQPARDATRPRPVPKDQLGSQAYDPHCEQPQNHDDADLCAQWGAVRAVAETNRLTRIALRLGYVGFWIALMGGLFGVVGTILLWLAWQETRAANRIARREFARARLEARRSMEHARSVAETDQRPWVDFTLAPYRIDKREHGLDVCAVITIKNTGRIPALDVRVGVKALYLASKDEEAITEFFHSGETDDSYSPRTLLPGADGETVVGEVIPQAAIDAVVGDVVFPLLAVNVRYTWAGNAAGGVTSKVFVIGPLSSIETVLGVKMDGKFPLEHRLGAKDRGLSHAS